MVWYFIGVYIINSTLHGCLVIRNFSSRVEKIFHSFAALALVKHFSTLEEKFRISPRPCNILYLWHPLETSSKYTITDCVALQKDIRWMYWYLREARVGKGKMNNFAVMYYVTILKLIWNIVNLTNWTKIENSTITTLKIFFAKNKYEIRSSLYCL